jgi:hypothetical protein
MDEGKQACLICLSSFHAPEMSFYFNAKWTLA